MPGKYFEENKDFTELIYTLDKVVRKVLVPVLFFMGIVLFFCGIRFLMISLTVIFAIYFFVSAVTLWGVKRGLFPGKNAYFILLVIDCVLVAFSTYYSGGAESFMPFVYTIIGVLAGLTLPIWGVLGVIFAAALSYLTEISLEAAGVIGHIQLHRDSLPPEVYATSNHVRSMFVAFLSVNIAVTFIAYTMADWLRGRAEKLGILNKEIKISFDLLVKRDQEIAVANRYLDEKNSELETLKESLEELVGERTKELREKVGELEEFHDLTVGRELKMIELEKEIEKLRREIK